jgi:hypothetical protein
MVTAVVVSSCTFFDEGYLLTEEFVYSLTLRLLTCSAAVSDSVTRQTGQSQIGFQFLLIIWNFRHNNRLQFKISFSAGSIRRCSALDKLELVVVPLSCSGVKGLVEWLEQLSNDGLSVVVSSCT